MLALSRVKSCGCLKYPCHCPEVFLKNFIFLVSLTTNGQGLPSSSPWILIFTSTIRSELERPQCFVITSPFPLPGTVILPVTSHKDALPYPAQRAAESRTQLDCKLCTSFSTLFSYFLYHFCSEMWLNYGEGHLFLPSHDSALGLGH